MYKKILVLSPTLDLHGGNIVTLCRIRDYIENHGHSCELSSPMAFTDPEMFRNKVKSEDIQMLIGIHAYKTGIFMKDSKLPFILIIGGTDVNVMAKETTKLEEMSQVVSEARCVVCFSSEIKDQVKRLWPNLDNSHLKVIPQGIEIHHLLDKTNGSIIKKYLQNTNNNNNAGLPAVFQDNTDSYKPVIFTLIAGIRAVKDPLYLAQTFQEWHAHDDQIFLLVVGYVLDESYTEKEFLPVVRSKPGVLFIPGVSIDESHAIMKESFAVINSSESEGMCLAILEAMGLEVPVLARDNEGNRSIVDDGNTGLIFTSPQTFITKAKWLIDHPNERSRIVKKAKEFVMSNHNPEDEKLAYIDAVNHCIH